MVESPVAALEVPAWLTHLETGLRHVGSVTADGHVHLGGLGELHALEDKWLREHGLGRLP